MPFSVIHPFTLTLSLLNALNSELFLVPLPSPVFYILLLYLYCIKSYKFLLTSLLIVLGISDFLYSTFSFTSFTFLHRSIFICLFSHLLLYFSNTASTSSCTFLILSTNSIVFSFFQYLLSSATLFHNSL